MAEEFGVEPRKLLSHVLVFRHPAHAKIGAKSMDGSSSCFLLGRMAGKCRRLCGRIFRGKLNDLFDAVLFDVEKAVNEEILHL